MKKILVTTDFSANSEAGIRFAIQLASQSQYELIFYNVFQLADINTWTDLNYNDAGSTHIETGADKLRKFIMAIYKKEGKKAGKVDFIIENKPDVDQSIMAYAQQIHASYICLGTRGGGVISKFLGTNASTLITKSPIPLLVVPRSYHSRPIISVLYASDLEKIEHELEVVQSFATAVNASIAVYNYDEFIDEEGVRNKQEIIARKFKSPQVTFHFEKCYLERSLLDHLKDDIQKINPSVIAMFTKQDRNWFERLFLSSKTAELGFDTRTPLLVFRK